MRSGFRMIIYLFLFGAVAACDDDDCPVTEPEYEGPSILHMAPPSGESIDAEWGRLHGDDVYVQFGDPQGFDDLGTGQLSIEQVRVLDVVARDYLGHVDLGGICNNTGAVYDSVLPFDVASMIPSELGGLAPALVEPENGLVELSSILCFSEWCPYAFLDADLLTTQALEFGPSVEGGCTTAMALIGVYPPLRDPASDIIITRIELEFVNVEVTVYDASGDSVTAVWPSLRIDYTHPDEMP